MEAQSPSKAKLNDKERTKEDTSSRKGSDKRKSRSRSPPNSRYRSRRRYSRSPKRSRSRSRSRDRERYRRRHSSPKRSRSHKSSERDESPRSSRRESNRDRKPSKERPSRRTTETDEKTTNIEHDVTNDKEDGDDKKRRSGWDRSNANTDNVDNNSKNAENDAELMRKVLEEQKELEERVQRQKEIALQQANLIAERARLCRIYVGSLNFDLGETEVRAAFSAFGNVKNVNLSRDSSTGRSKGFCFVEYELPEAAENALKSMNGVVFGGRAIKVGRPVHTGGLAAGPGTTAVSLPQSQPIPETRIYIGSVYWELTPDDLRTVFQSFGPIKSCILMPNPETGKHKGYGFIDFQNVESAHLAIQHMNGAELGGRQIKVGRAQMGIGQGTTGTTSSSMEGTSQKLVSDSLAEEEDITISSSQRVQIMQKLARDMIPKDSRVVILRNMVTSEQVDEDLEQEISDECSKFGAVEKVVIYQDAQGTVGIVKVFVLFYKAEDAAKAVAALNGRWFGGRLVKAEPYEMIKFEKQDYSK